MLAKHSLRLRWKSNRIHREVRPDPLMPPTLKSMVVRGEAGFLPLSQPLRKTSLLIYLEALFDIL